MRPRVSVLITNQDKFILIFRHKDGEDYYAIPGGGIESGETPMVAAFREIDEELGLKLRNLQLISEINTEDRHDYNFLAETDDLEITVTGPEKNHLNTPENLYQPQWLDKKTLNLNLPIYPTTARIMFSQMFKNLK
ncbi:MAG: NUDIX domain-containing protein [Candidatus Shapirobacteria bacterium]